MGKKSKGMSPRMRRASGTNDAVERILAVTNEMGGSFRTLPEAAENIARMRRGLEPVWSPAFQQSVSFDEEVVIVDHIARYAIVDLWRKQGRLAYDIHPAMANSLYRSDLKGKLPGELFSRLRHISPMIPLPHAWPFKGEQGKKGLIRAYFLTGRTGRAFCSTTDAMSEGLALMAWIDMWDEETGEYDHPVTPVLPLPATPGPFTLDDIIRGTNEWHGTGAQANDRRLFKQLVPGALTMLSYLCCKNAEIEKPPPQPTTGKRRQAPSRDPFYVRVGWYTGPKLHAAGGRTGGRVRGGISVPSGVEYGPQHRVGHPKTVWVGPGRTKNESIWVDPYWTKLDMLDEDQEPVTQVVPVDPQRGDPSSHKDIRRANLGTAKSREIAERERQQHREDDWEF